MALNDTKLVLNTRNTYENLLIPKTNTFHLYPLRKLNSKFLLKVKNLFLRKNLDKLYTKTFFGCSSTCLNLSLDHFKSYNSSTFFSLLLSLDLDTSLRQTSFLHIGDLLAECDDTHYNYLTSGYKYTSSSKKDINHISF